MYYLYGIGAFNEGQAMLKSGIDTAFTARWRRLALAFCPHHRRSLDPRYRRRHSGPVSPGVPLLLGAGFVFPVANFAVAGHRPGPEGIIILARKFTINQSDSTYGADVDDKPVTFGAASSVP